MTSFLRIALARLRTEGPLGLLALMVGAVSLTYPLGADQGLFFYTSREWLLRGAVPYKDVLDHKWPFIYVIHAATIALFGEESWSLRLAELLVVPVAAYLGARLAAARGQRVPDGAIGAAWLGISIFYFGWFDFWDTGQCEIWYATFSLASIVIVLRAPVLSRGKLAGAGALIACACLIKPTAACFGLVAVVGLVLRGRVEKRDLREQVDALVTYLVGGTFVVTLLLGYFAAKGAIPALLDVLIGANGYYVAHEPGARTAREMFSQSVFAFRRFLPMSTLFFAGTIGAIAIGLIRRAPDLAKRHALPLALAGASMLTVAVQLKFYHYHWGTMIPAVAVCAATLHGELVRLAPERVRTWAPTTVFLAAAALLLWQSEDRGPWWASNVRVYRRFVSGAMEPEAYAASFDRPEMFFYNGDAQRIGAWMRRELRDGETVAVRGFEAHFYSICHCRYSGRFYWTAFLVAPTRNYRRAEWTAEDLAELALHPPRFVVTPSYAHEGLESAELFEARGYRRNLFISTPAFVVLERPPGAPPL